MPKIYKDDDMLLLVKMWAKDVEEGALAQIKNLSNLPFAFHHVAIMPDCHQGYGMPIGGVLATKGVVIPNAVGVDIGCGMCAIKTSLKVNQLDRELLKKIMGNIREVIPVGFEHHKENQDESLIDAKYLTTGNLAHHKESIKYHLELIEISVKEFKLRFLKLKEKI